MAEYYQTMRQFLQVQERLMLAYLGGGAAKAPRPFSAPQLAATPRYAVAAAPRPFMNGHATAAPPIAVQPQAPLPVAVAPPAPVKLSSARVAADPKALLLQVASDRTGYPADMLGLDLNMEADLGIDSIKRVEILGAFRKMLPASVSEALSERMDDLSKAKSLQNILDLVAVGAGAPQRPFDLAGKGDATASVALSRPSGAEALRTPSPLARYVIRPCAAPLAAGSAMQVPGGIYVVIPDRLGVAAILSGHLERGGARVRIMPDAALANEDATGKWLGTVRAEDRIRGIVDLRPLRQPTAVEWSDFAGWRDAMKRDVKTLFPVLRLSATDLASGGLILVASGMGGHFGRDWREGVGISPGAGGAVGLLKCLTFEWPGCQGKAIDLDPREPVERLSEQLYAELAVPGGRREVGYPGGIRTIFRTEPASLIPSATPIEQPDRDWVVLAIGGARGITAETLREFAAARATCVIVGRTAPPGPGEAATTGIPDAAALRAHFLRQAKDAGERPMPAAIEARIVAVLRDREIRANLAGFAAAGARVDTRICDVNQEADVAALLGSVYERYGRIDAVLFGAGLIEDQLLVNKTSESMARVFDTKVDGAFLIARALKPEYLKFFALFTSVAGRYGNRGQTDYAAANEVLNRFAWLLQAKWGTGVKVSAINWGPWANTTNGPGMLTPETARQFRERGVNLIEPAAGRVFLLRELLYAPRDEVEVVAGEHPWEYFEAAAARGEATMGTPTSPPLLHTSVTAPGNGEGRKLGKTIDLVSDPYLDEHRIDGTPVLPIALAAEYMAEAATVLDGMPVRALTGVRRLNGLVLRGRSLDVEIAYKPAADGMSGQIDIVQTQPERRAAYRGTVELGAPPACTGSRMLLLPIAPAPRDVGDIYRRLMFHGPKFQTVRDIVAMTRDRIVAAGIASRPGDYYPPAAGQDWLFDPGIVDGAIQLVFMWTCEYRGSAFLPSALGRIERFGDQPLAGDVTFAVEILQGWTDSQVRWRFEIIDASGLTRLSADDCEGWIDPSLNRLHGGWAGGVAAEQHLPAEA
jgi:NAD(P)-dependent dehydrogenase (short-subunit alcohol dehydrogenase family)